MFEKDHGHQDHRSKKDKRSQKADWRQRRWCWVSDEIGRELFIMSCCRQVKRLIMISINNCDWSDWFRKSNQNRKGCLPSTQCQII